MLREHYYWPAMERDVQHVLKSCGTYQVAKSHLLPYGLYIPLSIPTSP